jgi:two-component system, NarL family, sensor histidine kinase FusK
MGKAGGHRGREWLLQVAVALAYALAYCVVRPFSDAHWSLTSGLRLACLLLIPYRYWFALAVGEVGPLAYSVFEHVGMYGVVTASIWSIPPIVVAMPAVWFCRRRLGLFPAQRVIDMKALLICALGSSMLWALVTYAGFLTADPTMHATPVMLAGVFVGSYVAVLTIVTWPLFFRIARNGRSLRGMVTEAMHSTLTWDTLLYALPALLAISFASAYLGSESAAVLQMSLFLPVAWLTLKYGWRGAAVTGPVAVACVCALTLSVPDPIVIQAQFFVAFAVTFLFLMGARIASQIHAQEQERLTVGKALGVVQQVLHQGEVRLRQTSAALEIVGGNVSISQSRVLQKVQRFLSPDERAVLNREASATKNRIYGLAESMHPVAWRERGLPAALRESIGRILDEGDIAYECVIQGRGLSKLAAPVHQAIYRITCESVGQVCAQQACDRIKLTLRGGETQGRRWAMIRVTGIIGEEGARQRPSHSEKRADIAAKLGAGVGAQPSIAAQAELFDGLMHARPGNISVLLYDAHHLTLGTHIQPRAAQLWVR